MLGASATSPPSEAGFCDADVVAVWHTIRVDEALLLKMPNARAIVRWVLAPDACAPFRIYLRHAVLIGRMGVGYDNVDTSAAGTSNLLLTTGGCLLLAAVAGHHSPLTTHHPGRLGIAVCNIPDYGTEEVADSTLALILGLYRGVLAGVALLDQGNSFRGPDAIALAIPYIRRVRGSTLGLVGLGRIGSAVALRAKACGFDVAFFDPHREVYRSFL